MTHRKTKGEEKVKQKWKATEDEQQAAIMEWCQLMEGRWPELRLIYHVPNEGKRTASPAGKMQRMGMKSGVPDMMLPVARGNFHGLYLELKTETGRESKAQRQWREALEEQGYMAALCFGLDAALDCLKVYMTLGPYQGGNAPKSNKRG